MTCAVCNGTGYMVVVRSAPADGEIATGKRPCIMGCKPPAATPAIGGVANNAPLKGREVRLPHCRIGRVRLKGMKPPTRDYDGPPSETISKRDLFGIDD